MISRVKKGIISYPIVTRFNTDRVRVYTSVFQMITTWIEFVDISLFA